MRNFTLPTWKMEGDVLLGMPQIYRICSLADTDSKKITVVNQRKTHVLDVSFIGDFVPVISASAIPNIMKTHVTTYLVLAKDVNAYEIETEISAFHKDRQAFLSVISSQSLRHMSYLRLKGPRIKQFI